MKRIGYALLLAVLSVFFTFISFPSAKSDTMFVVSYDYNCDDSTVRGLPDDQIFTVGQQNYIVGYSPHRNKYTFLGWSEDPKATEAAYLPGDPYTGAKGTTLYLNTAIIIINSKL